MPATTEDTRHASASEVLRLFNRDVSGERLLTEVVSPNFRVHLLSQERVPPFGSADILTSTYFQTKGLKTQWNSHGRGPHCL